MLDKDPEDRIPLSEILKMQCVISSAKSQLSAELFNAELTNYDPNKPMPLPKSEPVLPLVLPVKANAGTHDTQNMYKQ